MKRILTIFVLFLTALGANASTNTLQTVQIDPIKDTYNIILTSDNEVEVKKTVQSSNKIILTIKDIKASKTLNTIYNNTTTVDSVVVEPVGSDSLNIIIQADNAAQAAVTFETLNNTSVSLPTTTVKQTKKKSKKTGDSIVLSKPIEAYTPVYNQGYDEELDEESDFSSDASGVLGSVVALIKKVLGNDGLNNLITAGLFGVIVLCVMKLFKKSETPAKVGLSQSLKDREVELYKDLVTNRGIQSGLQNPMSTFDNIQPLQQPTMPTVNPNASYGLKAYQSSNKNPYITSDIMQRPVSPLQMNTVKPNVEPKISTTPLRTNMSAQNSMAPARNLNARPATQSMVTRPEIKPSNVDSVNFLDAMTKIYEKNGRADLANSLKAGMAKAKINV